MNALSNYERVTEVAIVLAGRTVANSGIIQYAPRDPDLEALPEPPRFDDRRFSQGKRIALRSADLIGLARASEWGNATCKQAREIIVDGEPHTYCDLKEMALGAAAPPQGGWVRWQRFLGRLLTSRPTSARS